MQLALPAHIDASVVDDEVRHDGSAATAMLAGEAKPARAAVLFRHELVAINTDEDAALIHLEVIPVLLRLKEVDGCTAWHKEQRVEPLSSSTPKCSMERTSSQSFDSHLRKRCTPPAQVMATQTVVTSGTMAWRCIRIARSVITAAPMVWRRCQHCR